MEEEVVTYCQDRLPYISFHILEEMRKNNELCDITLKIQQRTIIAHSVILAAGIPYFRSLLNNVTGKMKEKEIAMEDMDPDALESLIHFAYSSKINISVQNAHSLIVASDFLQLGEVKEACVEFLSERLNIYNVLEVCTLARHISNAKLTESCNSYIQQNFEEFSKSNDFLSLPYESVKNVISRDKLNVSDEENVFEAVIDWVKFSPPERHDMLPDLLREVHMTSLPTDYLIQRVATEKYVKSSTPCRDFVQDVQSFHLLSETERASLKLNTAPGRGREREIYAVCNSASLGYSVYHCDFLEGTWYKLESSESHKEPIYHVVACNDRIYVFLENLTKIFHMKTHQWELLEAAHERRNFSESAVVAHGSLIYCFGSDDRDFCDTVHCFDTKQNIWLEKGKMNIARGKAAAASVKDVIYVTGGYKFLTIFNTAEKYDPETEEWCNLPPMLQWRSHHGCASVNGKIYVSGGISAFVAFLGELRSFEMYNPATNMWNFISPMGRKRTSFSFVSRNKKIYAIGGSPDMEIYNPEFDWWNWSFKVPDGFVGAVVM